MKRYLTKSLLHKYLKKIIKTKINRINLPTKELFMSALLEISHKSADFVTEKTQKLLALTK